MGTRNCPATDCTYLNLGYWRNTNDYREAAEAMVDLLGDAAGIGAGAQPDRQRRRLKV